MAVLGVSAASLAQLDQSVQAIYEHAVGLDRAPARARIAELESHLGELHRDIGALRTRISASIARERDSYTIGTATHSPVHPGSVARRERRRPRIHPGSRSTRP